MIRPHLERLSLPPAAVEWLDGLWSVIQVLDDVADADPVEQQALRGAIYTALVGLPSNAFFQAHSAALMPMLASSVLKWVAADDAERNGQADERSFVWRAGYYDVVLMVCLLVHGPEQAMRAARDVLSIYGETFTEYRQEFKECNDA
jgi:hypothetical protein